MSDIVERLRAEGENALRRHLSLGMHQLCGEAAAEIERLRATLGMVKQSVLEAADEAERLQGGELVLRTELGEVEAENERLRVALRDVRYKAVSGRLVEKEIVAIVDTALPVEARCDCARWMEPLDEGWCCGKEDCPRTIAAKGAIIAAFSR